MDTLPLSRKIARLVEERGWNQEDFARIAQINRHTARQIMKAPDGRAIRNATLAQCATALGLRVSELRELPLERLLPRMHGQVHADEQALKMVREQAEWPPLKEWLRDHPDRVEQFTSAEAREILNMQGAGGPLDRLGVEACVRRIERTRHVLRQAAEIAKTEHLDLLEGFLAVLHEKAMR